MENNTTNTLAKKPRERKTRREAKSADPRRAPVRENMQAVREDKAVLPIKRRDKVEGATRKRGAKKTEEVAEARTKTKKIKPVKNAVKIIFLGGVGEIGKNMTAIECGDDIIVIDAGIIFPTEETPGIDLVVPDITYLVERRKKVRGLLLTHGHEDHIGGVPYLLKEISTPVIGTKLTLALVDNKLREHRLNNVVQKVIEPGSEIQLGCFKITFINVNHSIAGAVALAIRTPQGVIFHSGDFKIDLTPVAGSPIDLKTIADIGSKGVLLYLGESTNIERPGYTMSETVVGTTLDRLFAENSTRRLIIATFASNVHRLQQIIDLAVKFRRRVALNGRSMLNVVEAAEKIGEINIPEGVIVDITKKLQGRPARRRMHGQPGRTHERADANGKPGKSRPRGRRQRHHNHFGFPHTRQREGHIRGHKQALSSRRGRHIRKPRKYPRFGSRLPRRAQDNAYALKA